MPITINGSGTVTGLSVGGLPDGTVDTDTLANSAVTSAKSSGLGGLTEYDTWRLTSDTVNALNPLVNWARTTSNGFAKIGTGMSHSGGTFTFPSTGIWEVTARPHFKQTNGGDSDHMYMDTDYTTDNGSNWTATTYAIGSNIDNNGQCTAISIFTTDITDTSNQKVRFSFDPDNSNGQIQGNTSILETNLTFKKLAET